MAADSAILFRFPTAPFLKCPAQIGLHAPPPDSFQVARMFKNFSPQSLGINGRQSELIELALTYAFRGMDIDMGDMLRRTQRTSIEDATKYVRAAEVKIGGFELEVNLDADDDTFTNQVATLHPLAELAAEMKAFCAYIRVPAATDRLPYHEYFDIQRGRLTQIAEVLSNRGIKFAIGFRAGKELEEGKQFPFVRNAEGLLELVRGIGVSGAGVLLDTWDWQVGEGTMAQIQDLKAEEIVAVRLGSVPADVDPSQAVTKERILPELEGPLNHVALIKHLDAIGFDGPVSPTASSLRYKGQTRESIVQQGQEAVDQISRDAGLHVAPRPMDLIETYAMHETVPEE